MGNFKNGETTTMMLGLKQRYYFRMFLHIGSPILCGSTIYALWRSIYLIDPAQTLFPLLDPSRVPQWVKYNLPDGLWFYALLSSLIFIWREIFSRHFLAWLLLAIIMSFFLEISQAYHLIPGTFDWNDLLAYLIAATLCFLNFNKQLSSTIKRSKQ
jgi:hypothetical protein